MSRTKENEKDKKSKDANANVTRRQALSKMGMAAVGAAAVVVVGGVAYYLSSQPPAPPPSITPTTTAAPTTIGPPVTTAPATITPGGKPVRFNCWAFHPEIIQENMDIFNQQYGENGELIQSPGDYYGSLETRLMTGPASGIDMMYMHSDWLTRYYKAGWIQPVNDEEHFDEIRNDYGNKKLLDTVIMPDGKQCAWVYFNGTVPLFYNGKVLKKAGVADDTGHIKSAPKTWDDFVQMCRDIKKSGASDAPYWAKWGNCGTCGINETFDEYCVSEGEQQFDPKTQEPTFENDTVLHMLENMRTLMAEGLVSKGVLATSEQDNITGFASGKYAFTELHDYDLNQQNDPAKSPDAGWYHWMPNQPGKKGWYPFMGAHYAITSHSYMKRSPNDAKRVERLHQFYSWKDKNGEYLAGRKWIKELELGQPYTKFYEDPEIKASWLRHMDEGDFEVRKNAHMNAVLTPSIYIGCVWFAEYHGFLNDVLPKMVLGESGYSPRETLTRMVDKANELRKTYGGAEVWE